MSETTSVDPAIAGMPRGGPNASWLRAYSPSAFAALGKAADPQMQIEFLPSAPRFGAPTVVVFSRSALS
jgi:hypothetical protein